MKPVNPPPVEHLYTYDKFPRSGNDINGLGVTEKIRPSKIAPDDFTIEDYDYKHKWDFFFYTMPWSVFKQFTLGLFESRKARSPIARKWSEVLINGTWTMTNAHGIS